MIATWTLLRLTRKLSVWVVRFKKGREKEEGAKFGTIFKRSLDIIIYTVAGIIILNFFGIKVTPILATLGVGGIAVALALQDTLENFFSGFYIVTDKSVKLGDLIELEGGAIKGHVEDIGWRTTRIKTLSGNMIIIPNSKLSQAITTNYDLQNKQTSVIIPVSVSYDSDLEKVEKTSEQVAKKIQKNTKGAVSAFEPIIRYNMFGDNGIHFKVILKAEHETGKYLIKHEFIKALHKEFKKQKIEMPYPQMDVHLKK
ncbi:mechanosensitive ion channel protein MscS [Candidatus Woesearchaeota archaeon ex4484_78]|nr:MAG: mechanosensitive ion channel protein MscS [Candidatus Woesearchaeota archaeon ex4484_78]